MDRWAWQSFTGFGRALHGLAELCGAWQSSTGLGRALTVLAELYRAWQSFTGAWISFLGLGKALWGLAKLYGAGQSITGLGNAAWQVEGKIRHDICHMHHMQRMCKIISPWVKFYILKVLLNSLFRYHFGFW